MDSSFAFLDGFDELQFIYIMSKIMIFVGVIVAICLVFLKAEYGRYFSSNSSQRYGFGVNVRVAWFVQELPAFLIPCVLLFYARKDALGMTPNTILLSLLLLHYTQRSLIYPWLITGGKPTPIFLAFLALQFCALNGYLQARYLTKYAHYEMSWLSNPCFVCGVVIFLAGMAINIHSDHTLRNLRKPGETGYKIPRGGMFTYVSGANFLGEIIEWSGFALACWSLPSLAFASFTALNIGPRAIQHHKWYLEKFEDYPKSRKALIPFVL
ncbi:3-oxo-5-alpha-steroid 4-dehydrogenase 1 [Desmophyllum pertusum]|uniref:3-oxo-5alpha-steroid 4-dehydrogenase (NADP(+)) n=1 Tax=Desmophyllum pertusum TaxID=174260 RepID=A0A9X0D7W1_9CNID|nr:3-oxo-5-alpha-steroid 4-dehydrogenase 1 [Desmophyllum pertusum]